MGLARGNRKMQKIRFGLSLDGQSDWQMHDVIGESTVGPRGLLGLLETQLGLLRFPVSQAERIVQMRECLNKVKTGHRFFERSFEVDELGTADALLSWRDRWFEQGWNGSLPMAASPRLRDMAAIEQLASTLVTPGPGQRLSDVERALVTRQPQFEIVGLVEPFDSYPLAWQRVLRRLPVVATPEITPSGEVGSLLRSLQDELLAAHAGGVPAKLPWRDDGSIRIVRGESRLAAAQWLARQMGPGDRNQAIVATSARGALDAALSAADQARLGVAEPNTFRPSLQLLPLAMRLLWAPLDFKALLQFLTHPVNPIPALARRRIADYLADTPGIGGRGWVTLLEKIEIDLGERASMGMAEIRFWIESERFNREDKVPLSAVTSRVERLAEFFRNRLLDEDDAKRAAWRDGHAQALALRQSARKLAEQGIESIGAEPLDKLVAQATGPGSGNAMLQAQTGAQACVTDPAALIEPYDEVFWWQLGATPLPMAYVWSKQELHSLREAGVDLPEMSKLLTRQAHSWLRPLLLARTQITLILPRPGEEVHPVWLLISGLLQQPHIQVIEDVLRSTPVARQTVSVPHVALPAVRRWWQLPAGQTLPWPANASYSSLEPMLFNPYHWVLAYTARLRASTLTRLPDDFRLLGNLAHRVVERLYRRDGSVGLTPTEVATWFDQEIEVVVDQEAAVMRMPGRRADLESFRIRFRRSLMQLHRHLQQSGATRIEPEKALEAQTSIGTIRGSSDLLLSLGDGREVIIDMKWAGADKYRKKLLDQTHLQLAIYGCLQREESGQWPAVGYYVLREGELLTTADGMFPGVSALDVPEGCTALMWQRAVATWKWRKSQLEAGLIELVLDGVEPDENSEPPADGLAIETLNPRYNPFIHLAGWNA